MIGGMNGLGVEGKSGFVGDTSIFFEMNDILLHELMIFYRIY